MKSMYVAELAVGDEVSELFAVRSVDLKEYSGGKMVSLELVDRTGRLKGIIWDGSADLMKNLKVDRVYKVRGSVTTYKGENQITVTAIEPCEEFDTDDFLPRGDLSYEELESKLKDAVDRIKDSDYKGLLKELFSNGEIKESFLNGVGGKLWHHNYVGGLAEHSLSMFDLCNSFCDNYEELDRDLILTGALLHDIGKIRTYSRGAIIGTYRNRG
jgi:3'-5' exoribonuclease